MMVKVEEYLNICSRHQEIVRERELIIADFHYNTSIVLIEYLRQLPLSSLREQTNPSTSTPSTRVPAPNSVPWPGKSVGGTYTPSQQQFIIYKSNSEDETETGLLHPNGPIEPLNNGDTIFIKVGDTIYFPGTIPQDEPNAFYDAGTSQYKTDGSYEANTDGAYIFTVSPGLPFKLPKVDMLLADSALAGTNFDGVGTITHPGGGQNDGPMVIHEIVVRRQRRLTQLL